MSGPSHLTLEKEIALELNPVEPAEGPTQTPTVRRETVLAMVSRSSQVPLDFVDLLNESGVLAASALEMEYFAYADIRRTDALHIGLGSVSDSTRNIEPIINQVTWNPGTSAFAFAIDAGHPIVIAPPEREKRFQDPLLGKHGIQTGVICPISYREHRYGAIGVFTGGTRSLTKDDALFIQSIALLLGPTRAHQNTERTLAEHSRFLSSAIDSLDAMVILLNDAGDIVQINRACQQLSGFAATQLRGRKIWSVFFMPSDDNAVQTILSELCEGSGQKRCESSFVARSGQQRRISWTLARIPGITGASSLLATGIDVTEQFRALSKLEEIAPELADSISSSAKANGSGQTAEDKALELVRSATENGLERRTHNRRPYPCVQSVAPCLHGKLPDRDEFREVRCHDISPRGFSFLLANKPPFEELIAAFGCAQSRLFLRARVVHVTPTQFEGHQVLLVGCEYTGRVRLPWTGENAHLAGRCSGNL